MNLSPFAPSETVITSAASRSMLYIDDNEANHKLMRFIIAMRPAITFLGADAGLPGIALAQKFLPGLVLLDYHLPDMDGDRVLELLLGDPLTARIPVLMLSGDPCSAQIERLLAIGASGYVTKPFHMHSLLASIDAFMGVPKA